MPEHKFFSLCLSQQDIYFDQLHNSGSPMYNIGGYIKCGQINLERMKLAHRKVVLENDVFGLRFVERKGDIFQYISHARDTALPVIDLSAEAMPTQSAKDWVNDAFKRPIFDYDSALYVSTLLKLSENEFWYVSKCHHLIMDGFGFSNWAYLLSDIYNGEQSTRGAGCWHEVVLQDKKYEQSKRYQSNETFWRKQCDRGVEKLFRQSNEYLPDNSLMSKRYNVPMSRGHFNDLLETAQRLDISIANLFIAALSVYFGLAYEQKTLAFGLPAHNRKNHIQKGMLGVFTNISPLLVKVEPHLSFTSIAKQINKQQNDNFRHQRYPSGHLSRLLGNTEDSYSFSGINFNFLTLANKPLLFADSKAEVIYQPQYQEHLPLTITLFEGGENAIELQYDYHQSYFSEQEILLLGARINDLLKQLLLEQAITRPICELSIIPDAERQNLLGLYAGQEQVLNTQNAIHDLFDQQSKLTPDYIALIYDNHQVSYKDLNHKVTQLAQYLIEKGVEPGSLVGIFMHRSPDMVISILATLKAGAAYVPLEPSLPQERLAFIINEASLVHVLTSSELRESLPEGVVKKACAVNELNLSEMMKTLSTVDKYPLTNTAYVIYTSGSTGQPKGVVVSHGALLNRIDWMDREYGLTKFDKVLQKTPFTFDVSVWEFLWPLSKGAQLVLAKPDGHKDPHYLCDLIQEKGITKLHFVPSMLGIMLKQGELEKCSSLKQVFCSGEALTAKQVNDFFLVRPETELHNLYGPTEAAIDVSYWPCTPVNGQVIPIGRAIQNTQLLVLDKQQNLSPTGVIGELYISGVGLADGYLGREELTRSAFIDNPYYCESLQSSSRKLYKTGDLVRYRTDGNLEYIGRNDTQIKLRGQRIELAEIEHILAASEDVAEAKVIVSDSDTLLAYVILHNHSSTSTTSAELAAQSALPSYMVPSQFITLEAWPLSANGKIDIKQLKRIKPNINTADIIAPSSEVQENILTLWSELLKIDKANICITSNFFRIGGNSLLCSEFIHQAVERYGYTLGLADIFKAPTLMALAEFLEDNKDLSNQVLGLVKSHNRPSAELSYVQYRIWLAENIGGASNKHNMSGGVKLSGRVNLERLTLALQKLVHQNSMLATRISFDNDGTPFQYIDSTEAVTTSYFDLSELDEQDRTSESAKLILSFCSAPFDMIDSTLFKVCVIKLSEEQTLLYFNFHHIISDGWSVNIAFNQFLDLYDDPEVEGLGSKFSYFDYVDWQKRFLSESTAQEQKSFWRDYLSECNQRLVLPFQRLKSSSGEPKLVKSNLSSEHIPALKQLAREHGANLTNVIHSTLVLLLSRISGQSDLTLGIPVSGRNLAGTADIIGPFLNNLPLRSLINDNHTFIELLKAQQQNLESVLSNQELPFEEILNQLKVERSSNDTPLFQVCLNFLNLPNLRLKNKSFSAKLEPTIANDNKFKLTFYVSLLDSKIEFECSYAQDYCYDDIQELLNQLCRLLIQIGQTKGEIVCSQLSLSTAEYCSSQSVLIDQRSETVVKKFERAAERTPDALAIHFEEHQWCYRELNNISSLYAQKLAQQGVSKGDVVAILASRNERLVVAMLATMKVGAAFLILPDNEPTARTAAKLAQVNDAYLLSTQTIDMSCEYKALVKKMLNVDFASLYAEKSAKMYSGEYVNGVICDGDDLAYIAFTSGSQGTPKAIKGKQSSLSVYTPWLIDKYRINQTDKFAMLSGLAHDPLQREIFTAFMAGAAICIPSEESFANLANWVAKTGVSVLNITPSLADLLLIDPKSLQKIRLAFLCGEPLTIQRAWQFVQANEELLLVNLYGATESCRALSYFDVTRDYLSYFSHHNYVPLGCGVEGVEILLLNQQGLRCSPGELGQIGIRAKHLTLGYLNDTLLTDEKFVVNQYCLSDDERVYLTGDYGRYDLKGTVHFAGRHDQQIKIRGFRVEPVEVEASMCNLAQVEHVAIKAMQDKTGRYFLAAYVVLTQDADGLDKAQLYTLFSSQLPEYMLPKELQFVDAIPLTNNGKVDWSVFSQGAVSKFDKPIIAPQGEVEVKLHRMWSSVLEKSTVSVTDSFFEAGGNSLSAMRLLSEVNSVFSVNISFGRFYELNSVREVAQLVELINQERQVVTVSLNKKNKISI